MTTAPLHSDLAPSYDRDALGHGIVHFGMGNFHRAHQAMYIDRLARAGKARGWGIVGVGVMEADKRMRDALRAQAGAYTLVLKHPDGHFSPTVIGSVTDMLYAPEEGQAVLDLLASPDTHVVSLTVTEGGYPVDDATGAFVATETTRRDAADPRQPAGVFGYIVEGLRRRREAGIAPFTVVSCDNLPGNGHIAHTAVVGQARLFDTELAAWIDDAVAFPNSMVDRITPVTTEVDREFVRERLEIDDAVPVTAEPFEQWVLEDRFTDTRPPLEDAGVQIVDDVRPYELMKLRLLNAAHQSLAHWGRLIPLVYAHEAAVDADVAAITRAYLEREARPTLAPVPGIDLDTYVDTLFERFSNASIADTLARLAQDASDRMPKFVLGAARDNLAAGRDVSIAAAMCAAWAAGVRGRGEDGSEILLDDQAAGPMSEAARCEDRAQVPESFLGLEQIFGSLGEATVFIEAFREAWGRLERDGVRALMRALAG